MVPAAVPVLPPAPPPPVLPPLDEAPLLLDAWLPLVEAEDDEVDDAAPDDALEEAPPIASPPVDDDVAAARPPEHAAKVSEQRSGKERRRPMRERIHGPARHGDEATVGSTSTRRAVTPDDRPLATSLRSHAPLRPHAPGATPPARGKGAWRWRACYR